MFIPVKDYLKRITFALEHVAAPQIESDFARGQVLAAVFLLDNLSTRIDYKPEVITKEIEKTCCNTVSAGPWPSPAWWASSPCSHGPDATPKKTTDVT